jgi:hypothetical protein
MAEYRLSTGAVSPSSEQVNVRVESAALTTSRAMVEISKHWTRFTGRCVASEEQPVSEQAEPQAGLGTRPAETLSLE